jgi:hypothetical protein
MCPVGAIGHCCYSAQEEIAAVEVVRLLGSGSVDLLDFRRDAADDARRDTILQVEKTFAVRRRT